MIPIKDQTLNVLYLTDNNYAVFAGVSITSLFMNNTDNYLLYPYETCNRRIE